MMSQWTTFFFGKTHTKRDAFKNVWILSYSCHVYWISRCCPEIGRSKNHYGSRTVATALLAFHVFPFAGKYDAQWRLLASLCFKYSRVGGWQMFLASMEKRSMRQLSLAGIRQVGCLATNNHIHGSSWSIRYQMHLCSSCSRWLIMLVPCEIYTLWNLP